MKLFEYGVERFVSKDGRLTYIDEFGILVDYVLRIRKQRKDTNLCMGLNELMRSEL